MILRSVIVVIEIQKNERYTLHVTSPKGSTTHKQDSLRLKKLRSALGMSTREFADMFGKTHATISYWENGKTEIPEIALKLLSVFEKEHSSKLKKK